ncbi:unnamed protein product [Cyclocybe aegerita]|uniref:Uncharacterized protein n=1 Tax=Cyclocybe aegerita TaxID=1973307 RepID=A0A8S0WJG3_CYCAE|nr:unnamed protein product [Cyclocybe aegerita]
MLASTIFKRSLSKSAIKWIVSGAYNNNLQRKSAIEEAIVKYAADNGIDARGAVDGSAEVRGTEHAGTARPDGTWNPNEPNHVTVNFKKSDGSHITTRHVYI